MSGGEEEFSEEIWGDTTEGHRLMNNDGGVYVLVYVKK